MAAVVASARRRAQSNRSSSQALGKLNTFNDVRMRLRQNLTSHDDWTGVQFLSLTEPWKLFGNVVQEMVLDCDQQEMHEVNLRVHALGFVSNSDWSCSVYCSGESVG